MVDGMWYLQVWKEMGFKAQGIGFTYEEGISDLQSHQLRRPLIRASACDTSCCCVSTYTYDFYLSIKSC